MYQRTTLSALSQAKFGYMGQKAFRNSNEKKESRARGIFCKKTWNRMWVSVTVRILDR